MRAMKAVGVVTDDLAEVARIMLGDDDCTAIASTSDDGSSASTVQVMRQM